MDDLARTRIAMQDDQGRAVGSADIEVVDDSVVRASLHVEAGHVQPGARARLVDAVMDAPEVVGRRRLEASLPLGDTEILHRVRARTASEETRAAGASCLVDAELPEREPEPGG